MRLIIKIRTIVIFFLAPFTLAQNVDVLIKRDFAEKETENRDISESKTTTSENQDLIPEQRDIFNFNTVKSSEVDGFNGKTKISIPIYEIKQDGLVIPVQLVYNSGGIKVDQFATEVGLGWSLDAGVTIDKEIVGSNDYRSVWSSTQAYGLQEYTSGYLSEGPSYGIDGPDIYNVNLKSGKASFILDKSYNPILISPYNGFNVSLTQGRFDEQFVKKYGFYGNFTGVSGVCASRPIVPTYLLGYYNDYNCQNIFRTYRDTKSIDVIFDRYTYSFKDADYSIQASAMTLPRTCPPDGSPCWENSSDGTGSFINKYNITDITDNLTQKKVSFYYEELSGSNSYVRHSKIFNTILDGVNADYVIPSRIVDGYSRDYDIYIKKLVSKIVTDKEQIEFVYLKEREDSKSLDIILNSPTNFNTYYKDPLLSKIYIKDKNNTIISTYSFTYEYFDSQCTNQNLQRNAEQCKRLKLTGIVKSKSNVSEEKEEYRLEYYEDTALPQIGSYRQDPFGYKSSLSDSETSELDPDFQRILPKKPKMYTYEDTINNSNDKLKYVSTVKIAALNPTSDTGYEQILSNLQDSRAWSLKAIEYPTRGKQIFNYELNSFSWKGNVINGGGIRVSKIDLIDGSSSYSTKYLYENGKVISLPTNNGYTKVSYASSNSVESRVQNFYSGFYKVKGSVVTYEKVSRMTDDKGKIVSEYTSINEFPLKIDAIHNATNSPLSLYPYYFGAGSLKFSYLQKEDFIGNVKNEYIYDKNNILLKEINFTYSNQELSFPADYPLIINLSIYPAYDPNLELYFYPIGYTGGYDPSPKFTYLPVVYKKLRNNLVTKKITDYLASGNIISTENYTYLDAHNAIKLITRTYPTEVISQEYLYPFESGLQYNTVMSNDFRYKYLKVGERIKKNSNFVDGTLNVFSLQNTNQLLPSENKRILNDNTLLTESTYDKYDAKGNLLQYTTKDGTSTTIIWGYNQTQPIAKIEGAKLSDINQSLIDSIVSASDNDAQTGTDASEQSLISALDLFRNNFALVNYQISTYTYDPLIGVKSITPASGIREIYSYDSMNRLEKIVGIDEKIIKEYKYNYRPTIYYNSQKSQSFIRNNCGSNAVGGSYNYIVPANQYTSVINKADADQKALDDINTNGQNAANVNGTCIPISCSIGFNSSIGINGGGSVSVQSNGYYKVSFGFSSGSNSVNLPWSTGVTVGTISGACKPTTEYSSYNGQVYYTIKTNGDIILKTHGSTLPNNTSYNYEIIFPIN